MEATPATSQMSCYMSPCLPWSMDSAVGKFRARLLSPRVQPLYDCLIADCHEFASELLKTAFCPSARTVGYLCMPKRLYSRTMNLTARRPISLLMMNIGDEQNC